jgi:hypothetical protein
VTSAVLSVAEARRRPGDRVTVRGWLLEEEGTLVLASMLAESWPPQAGGEVLLVEDLAPGEVDEWESAERVRWSRAQLVLTGLVAGDRLRQAALAPSR